MFFVHSFVGSYVVASFWLMSHHGFQCGIRYNVDSRWFDSHSGPPLRRRYVSEIKKEEMKLRSLKHV